MRQMDYKKSHLLFGISLCLSTQFRKILILALRIDWRTAKMGAIFCAPFDTGSVMAMMSKP